MSTRVFDLRGGHAPRELLVSVDTVTIFDRAKYVRPTAPWELPTSILLQFTKENAGQSRTRTGRKTDLSSDGGRILQVAV